MAALWNVATVEERNEMVKHILEPGGLNYDVEAKEIAAMKPRPNFLPILRMLQGVVEYKETSDLFVTSHWSKTEPTGFEPAIFCVTGRHVRPLHHGSWVSCAGRRFCCRFVGRTWIIPEYLYPVNPFIERNLAGLA